LKTIVLEEPGAFLFTETEKPGSPGLGEALVRVLRVGICGTDLHAFRGRQPFFEYPRVLGHELAVEIIALGDGAAGFGLVPGDICAVEPYLNCGTCSPCRRGKTNCCESLKVYGVHIDGGMREQIIVPADKLHRADGVPADHLAMVEMLCIGAHAVRRAELQPGDPVLVVGAGPIGLGVMLFAKEAGAHVLGMELNAGRIDFAGQQLGVVDWVEPDDQAEAQLRTILDGDLPLVVFDATGNVNSMHAAFKLPASGGKLVYVGLVQDDIRFYDPEFHRREMTMMSSRNATPEDFAHVIRTIAQDSVDLDPWITHRATPETLIERFPDWLDPENGVVKAMLEL
jgi:2-desacetyl-2-hydroxyethyl bacteriochlorophyllide A dehydrogenase